MEPSEAVCLPGDPITARPALCVQPWVCETLTGSDRAASGPSPLHQPWERLPESQNTAMHGFVCDEGVFPYLAETLVVKETQSFENVSGVVPVISSHCAGEVPPVQIHTREISLQTLCTHRVHKIYLYFHIQKENLDINVLQQLSSMLYVASHVTQQKTMM